MAIEKNNFKVSRFDQELSPSSGETMSSDENELHRQITAAESDDDDDEFDDADSGAGSDDFDLLELGETRAEFCQIGDLTCSVPFELYDLPGLEGILSVDAWNEVLTEEEKFSLTKYLPDMDHYTFMRTLKELFQGENFHFGSPIKNLFEMLKGGLCEPRVALYREGLNLFQKRQHYHLLRKHHNSMVSNFCLMRDAWLKCKGYSIEEKLRVLNIMRSQKSLMNEKMDEVLKSDSSEKEGSGDGFWRKRIMDRKSALKLGHNSAYGAGSNLEYPSKMPSAGSKVAKYGKQNPKGILKLAGSKITPKEMMGQLPYHNLDMNSRLYRSTAPVSRQKKVAGYDSGAAFRLRDQMRIIDDDDGNGCGGGDDDIEDETYELGIQPYQNLAHDSVMDKSGLLKARKRHNLLRSEKLVAESLVGLPFSSKNDLRTHGRSRTANQLPEAKVFTEKPHNIRNSCDLAKKVKYPENVQQFVTGEQIKHLKGRGPQLLPKGNQVDLLDPVEPIWHGKNQGHVFTVDSSFKSNDWDTRNKKRKAGSKSPDLNFKAYKASSPQVNDRILLSELRSKQSQQKIRANFVQSGKADKGALKVNRMNMEGEETESDSSDQFYDDEEENNISLTRIKSPHPSVITGGSRSSLLKSSLNAKKASFVKKDIQENALNFGGITHPSKKVGSFSEFELMPGYSSKAKQMRDSRLFHSSGDGIVEELGNFKDDDGRKRIPKFGRNGQFRVDSGGKLNMPSLRASSNRKKKAEVCNDYANDDEDDLLGTHLLTDENALGGLGKKRRSFEAYVHDGCNRSDTSLLGCNSVSKKRKAEEKIDMSGRAEEDNLRSNLQQQTDDSLSLKRRAKKKSESAIGASDMNTFEPPFMDMATVNSELETKPQKRPYTPITPTVHTGFSFSIIHLLSAVRMAMTTPLPEDSLEVGKPREEHNRKGGMIRVVCLQNVDENKSDHAAQVNVPSLTIQEIVNRVRSNPGDPCILETQEPLQDLVRGVLKIFSSKTAPLGAKGWKALVVYEKSTKSWPWIGPVSHTSTDHETIEEVTSPDYWGLPHKMLVKLVDSFANWLKSGQETLQQIGSLPAPPLSLMQCNLDEKERFRDLRAQKSLNTISPSSEEVRAYFRREEVLRYSIPDRAFPYTAADGKKSIVAPLRRCGGKPTSKARDHFMLKRDRPPHVTILCLVRDAAARLPGSIGTRADVCTLIRDSQYIVEDVSDAQVNQVVSGALDRLHYERDPCVQFDGERKLWVYLHREREEEDFEDDGTSSTKKWKRQKKDPADQSDQGTVTVAFLGNGDHSGFDLGSDLNVEPQGTDDDKRADLVDNDAKQSVGDNVDTTDRSELGNSTQGHPMVWEALGLNPTRENKLLCQENSTNEDFDDETFGRERPIGLLSASL